MQTPAYRFGDVVYAPIPYADDLKYKDEHPGVVISSAAFNNARLDVVVMEITHRLHQAKHFGAILIHDWKASGLKEPSVIKPLVFTVSKRDIQATWGHLDARTKEELKKTLPLIFGFKPSPTSSSRRS